MARLLIKSEVFRNQVINLKLGINRFGRSAENDFQIDHPTISASHCQIVAGNNEIIVTDCGSTNGTFVAGQPIKEVRLVTGQCFRLGEIEFLIETTDVTIAIPKFDVARPSPPVVLSDGSLLCPRHPHARVTHQCTGCREVLCDACVHRLRRRGGRILKLCSLCSSKCEPVGREKKKRKSLFELLQRTVKLPFVRASKEAD